MFDVVQDLAGPFLLDHRAPFATLPALRLRYIFDTSPTRPLRLHVDRGLERRGHLWVPPTSDPEVPDQWTRPARSPVDLQVGPATLTKTPTTPDDLIRIASDLPEGLPYKERPDTRSGAANQVRVSRETLCSPTRTLPYCNRPGLRSKLVTQGTSANIRRPWAPSRASRLLLTQYHKQLDIGFYSLEARTSINHRALRDCLPYSLSSELDPQATTFALRS